MKSQFFIGWLCFAFSLGNQVWAQPMRWSLQEYPPAVMPINGKPGLGFRDNELRLIVANWPEVEHQFVVANIARTWLMLGDKEPICTLGALRTPEREKIAYFTPVAILPPLQLIVREDTVSKLPLNAQGEVLLQELLASTTLKGLLVHLRSYGKGLDEVIAQRTVKDAVFMVQASDVGKSIPLMLAAKRGDYIIEYEFVVNFYKQQNFAKLDHLIALPIAGFSDALTTNAVCPRTPWGQQAIRRIDAILTKTADSNGVRSGVEKWLSPETIKRYKSDMNAFALRRKKPADPAQFE
ncbi:MAG: TIGR02285 family protein [Rhodoferax sp.]|nr:TIGR02285 family protein [Rhodoferax sp.]